MFNVVFVGEVGTEVRRHLCMGEEFLVFTFDVFTEVGIVGRIMTNRFRRVLRLKCLETKEILHSEFELRFAILAATSVFVYTDCFFLI